MSKIQLAPPASGTATFTIASPATNTDRTLTLPDATGTVATLGTSLTLGTAQSSTSGTAIDFTGIPSWAKRVTVMFSGVSTSGTSYWQVRVGSGSFATTGYAASSSSIYGTNLAAVTSATTGFVMLTANAGAVASGHMTLTNISGNAWAASHCFGDSTGSAAFCGGGSITLSGTLDRVRITTVNGTDTFDAGTINIMWEG